MSLDDFAEDSPDISEGTTVAELMSIFGAEEVRRGIQYMDSLSDAQENYKESVEGADYAENFSEGVSGQAVQGERAEEINKKWASKSKESGLGVDDE